MAQAVLTALVARDGLADEVQVLSAGLGRWHLGQPVDPRAVEALRRHGYQLEHPARQLEASWFTDDTAFVGFAAEHLTTLTALAPTARVGLLRDWDPSGPGDLLDPFYGSDDDFEQVLTIIVRSCTALLADLRGLIVRGRPKDDLAQRREMVAPRRSAETVQGAALP